jgi:CrcB protein
MLSFNSIILVFLGGGLGCVTRYLISEFFTHPSFPKGTLIANVVSSLILGLLMGLFIKDIIGNQTKLVFMTGFCGGFSTFSTYSLEVVQLYQSGATGMAILYSLGSLILGIISILIGLYAAHMIVAS